jgi:hypothetical protein
VPARETLAVVAIPRNLPNDFGMRYRRYNHPVCEDFLRVDIRNPSFVTKGRPEWRRPAASVIVFVSGDDARFIHDNLDYLVPIVRTRCNYGGTRPWFLCPTCGDRRAVMHAPPNGGRFGCRGCLKLLYLSECDDEFGRNLLKVRRLEQDVCAAIGGVVCTAPVVERPKGQHLATYERRMRKLVNARAAFLQVWAKESGIIGGR